MACRDKRILHSDHHKRKKRQTYQLSQTGPARMCSFNPNKAKIVWNFARVKLNDLQNLQSHYCPSILMHIQSMPPLNFKSLQACASCNTWTSAETGTLVALPIGWNKLVPRKGFLHKDSTTASRVTCAPACLRVDALQDAFNLCSIVQKFSAQTNGNYLLLETTRCGKPHAQWALSDFDGVYFLLFQLSGSSIFSSLPNHQNIIFAGSILNNSLLTMHTHPAKEIDQFQWTVGGPQFWDTPHIHMSILYMYHYIHLYHVNHCKATNMCIQYHI